MEVLSSFKYLEICFSKVGTPRVGVGLKTFGAMKVMIKVWGVGLDAKREMYE